MNPTRMLRFGIAFLASLPLAALVPTTSLAGSPRLPTDVRPTFQSVHLNVDPGKMDYTGSVRVQLKVAKASKTLNFHAQQMKLGKIVLSGNGKTQTLTAQEGEEGFQTATAPSEIKPGDYTLEIDFSNEFDQRATSLYRLDSEGSAYCFTQFQATDARLAFPCWDEPSFKFSYQIVLTVPKADETISNTPIESQTVKGEQKTVVFQKTKPLPSYLLAIAIGPFEYVPVPGTSIPTRIVTPKGSAALAQVAAEFTPPILAALERYFGRPYPYEKLDMIAVPEFSPGAMENPGAITYGDRFLLFDPKTMSASQKRTLAQFTAHELAHMWFGDMVTMEWWDDLWLNEAFAEWMGNKIAEEVYPNLQINVTALFELQGAMYMDAQLATRTIRQPVESLANLLQAADPLTYKKGQATLTMFERWMGPETFRKGVLDYLQTHQWGNATADDLWAALSKAAGRDIHAPMSTFLDQPGIPLVHAEVLSDGQVRLSQRRFLHYGVAPQSPQLWQIPITLKYSDGSAARTHSLLLTEATTTVALPGQSGKAPVWLEPNANSTGYYRWSVDPDALQKLADVASSELTPLERIGFLQNLGALLDAGAIRGDDYCRLLASFADDPRPEVTRSVAGSLQTVKRAFVTPELEGAFATYVRRVLGPAAKRYGYDRAPNEEEAVSLLRPTFAGWLADDGHDEQALSHAVRLAKSFLADRGSVDPSMVNEAVRLSAIRGDATLLGEYKKRFEAATVPTDRDLLLGAIGNFRDPKLRAEGLAYTLSGPLRPHEIFTIPREMAGTVGQERQVLEWATQNYDAIVKKIPPVYVVYLPYVGTSCERETLDKTKAFFSMPEHTAPGMEAELARVLEAGNDCVGLRSREGKSVERYLTQVAQAK